MQSTLSYRHRVITDEDLVFIRRLVAQHPQSSRRKLSGQLCQAWDWVQANGALRSMVCRGLMLMLHRQGLIELPPVRRVMRNPLTERRAPVAVTLEQTALRSTLAELDPERFRGTCYRAANWTLLGTTTGRGKDAPTRAKSIARSSRCWVMPWSRTFASACAQ